MGAAARPAAAVGMGVGVAARDCAHPAARHRHGTREAYVADRCRCPGCTGANRAAGTRRRVALARGSWHPYTDPATAARHARRLRAAGLSATAIAAAGGVARSTVTNLLHPAPPRRIRGSTHRALLAIPVPSPAAGSGRRGGRFVDSAAARRQAGRLLAAGWTLTRLAAACGRTPGSLHRSLHGRRITHATAAVIARVYRTRRPAPGRRG